jgi:sulfur carrier protein
VIVNGVPHHSRTLPSSVTVLLVELGIEMRGIAVAVNGEIVRKSLWEMTLVDRGDIVEIVTAVAGG